MSPPTADVNSDCYYGVLGVERGAMDAEVTKAYRKLALKHHPDKNPNDKDQAAERFRKVSEAYDVLHDPEKRKNYDQFGKAAFGQGPTAPESAPFSGGSAFPGGVSFQSSGMSSAQAEELFRAMFSGQRGGLFGGSDNSMGMPGRRSQTFVFHSGAQDSSEGNAGSFMSFPFDLSGIGGLGGFSGGGGAQSSHSTPPYAMPKGTRVVVQGLAKTKEHNGKTGRVIAWDESSARYQVDLEGGCVLSLRPQRLVQLCRIEIAGLEAKPELNGRHGEIFTFDDSRGRYLVLLEDPAMALSLQPSHCILPKATCVVLSGLSSKQFNGQMAQIVDVHRDAARYTVQCQNGRQIRIKYENALC
mmetsp:Transcript_65792/g.147854  ORF Transcript_65792/g.147854 Transcript_65792/m.147854 type:complete len:357 (-) Transcript_65792:143-1213(-)